MMDELQQAYAAYQSALVNLPNPKVVVRVFPSFYYTVANR